MANIPVPVFKVGGSQAIVTFLYVVVMFGSAHLLATSLPNNKYAQAWLSLGF